MKQYLTLPQLPKQDSSGNINQQELIHFLSAIQRILSDKQREDYGENESLSQLVSANTTQITELKNNPFFHVRNNDNGTFLIKFSIIDKNIGNGYSSSTGRFTAPKKGKYLFNFLFLTAHESLTDNRVAIRKNNVIYPGARFIQTKTANSWLSWVGSCIIDLEKNDYVTIHKESTFSFYTAESIYEFWQGSFIGD